ncbi:hypothetical protein CPC16_009352 [Podila verticillata]|nr:hypothetical protein CPC16_009352 [Podila verticillata]
MATVLETLANLVKLSSKAPSAPPIPVYDKFLGLELTPANVLFLQSIVISLFAQFVLFYTTWYFIPSLSKDRRRLAWVPSFYFSILFTTAFMAEMGMMRTTVFERLGMDTVTLGLPSDATMFSYLFPKFNAWAMHLGSHYVQESRDGLGVILQQLHEWDNESLSVLSGTFLRWMVSQPVFSLAPLKPVDPAYIIQGAPYYFGGGGRLLFSMEATHKSSKMSAIMIGCLTGFFLGDNILAVMHYLAHHNLLSGWVHHVVYTGVSYSLARSQTMSIFAVCGGIMEPSTIILSMGHLFPAARSTFLFGASFFLLRIVCCALLWHEFTFNHPPNTGGAAQILSLCLILHSHWFIAYVRGIIRRAKRATKEKEKQLDQGVEQKQKQSESPQKDKIATGVSSSVVQLRFRSDGDEN